MARVKLTKRGNTWYIDDKPIKPGYIYYDDNEKQWKELKEDGNFHPYEVGKRVSGSIPTKEQLAIQFAKHDLAPSVPFLMDNYHYKEGIPFGTGYDYKGTEDSREVNRKLNHKYYQQVQDSINSRVQNRFYEDYPEQYKRDIQMRDQYKKHPTCPAGWTCINSVEGLRGNIQWSNYDFVVNNKYKSRGYKKIPLNVPNIEKVYNTMPIGSIVQTPDYGHSVMFLGDNLFYNNHGYVAPYKNGNQLEHYDDNSVSRWQDTWYKAPGFIFIKNRYGGQLLPKRNKKM